MSPEFFNFTVTLPGDERIVGVARDRLRPRRAITRDAGGGRRVVLRPRRDAAVGRGEPPPACRARSCSTAPAASFASPSAGLAISQPLVA